MEIVELRTLSPMVNVIDEEVVPLNWLKTIFCGRDGLPVIVTGPDGAIVRFKEELAEYEEPWKIMYLSDSTRIPWADSFRLTIDSNLAFCIALINVSFSER